MKNHFTALLALLILTGGISSHGYAEEKPRITPRLEILDDATMKKLAKLSEPSAQHRTLSSLTGTWDYTLKYWTKEDSDAQTSSGTLTNEMILGDQFLSSKTGLILNIGGQNIPYEGWGILGYDATKNVFTSVWIDTMRTGMMSGSGQYNEERKIIEEKGHFTHPLLEKEQAYRAELQFIDDDTYKRTIFMTGKPRKEFKVLEIEFNRRK